MNDRHPSGTMTTPAPASDAASAHYASYGTPETQYGDFTTYGAYDATGFDAPATDAGAHATTTFAADPLFGDFPGADHTAGGGTGSYDATQWTTGTHETAHYDAYAAQQQAAQHAGYDTGAYDTTAWTSGYQQMPVVPQQATSPEATGQWDAGSWLQPDQSGNPADQTQHWEWGTQAFDTGAYDATQWNTDGTQQQPDTYEPHGESYDEQADADFDRTSYDEAAENASSPYGEPAQDFPDHADGPDGGEPATAGDETGTSLLDEQEEVVVTGRAASRAAARAGGRSRRRSPAKRSALMTVAVPSACVMGVAGIAAASVSGMNEDSQETNASAADAKPVQPAAANNQLDTQLESLTAGADDFADRASRTQERIDLKAQQEAEKKRAAAEAARKERLRPKFALPVAQHGLSAYYGQAGINWMSVHSGIDFPVSYGTTVMAATDGTVRTQWNSAYGNMMIVTAKDGTETWYCHLSTYRVSSGTTVKAGDPIAYSGNSGNSTGPHLHFEVRPAGGSAIDPLSWFRSHGLDPQ
ncbi:M23 family metallopeptidase [Streptomyces sp. DH24]|uniref:M23 family metallopeptidase n=1 Tax=Streptomyces sp. DH24 TaxID=3040123 RepID=UPI00244174FB|nr:M23 family metallopeptidase [Streptomyces sp. DH24]MDG9716863.1 M23 family metallopeptidase [Streptomyces sp. DH24]